MVYVACMNNNNIPQILRPISDSFFCNGALDSSALRFFKRLSREEMNEYAAKCGKFRADRGLAGGEREIREFWFWLQANGI